MMAKTIAKAETTNTPSIRLPRVLQTKTPMGTIDDPHEREADRVADEVVQGPPPDAPVTPAAQEISRSCEACEQEELLRKKEAGPSVATGEAPGTVGDALRSAGEPLNAATRAYFEPRFGRDFSRVRVHVGAAAEQSARELNARAYTAGTDIVFGRGQYMPATNDGRRLLAHELTHAIQQSPTTTQSVGHDGLRQSFASSSVLTSSTGGPLVQRAGNAPDPEPQPTVLALGRYSRANTSIDRLSEEAERATGLRAFVAGRMPGFTENFARERGAAMASAMLVQEAIEGGGPLNIQAIYLNTAEVQFLRGGPLSSSVNAVPGTGGHTAAEYRNLVVALAANAHKVDVFLQHEGGLSIIRAQRQTTEGAPLPAFLKEYLPPSFFESPRNPPSGGPSGSVPPPARPTAPKSSSRSLLAPSASAKSAPTKGAAAGRAAAVVMLVAQVAEMLGILQRDPIFARAFAQKQNRFFANLGVQGQEYATADGNFTVYLPDHEELRSILFREITSWKDFSKFFVDASEVGLDFQYAQWVFVLPKDEEGSDVIYSVDAVIEDLFSHLEQTDGPRPVMWSNRAALQFENLEFTRRTAGFTEALVGEWRGSFGTNGVRLPVHVVFEEGTFFGLEGTYDYQSEGRREEGELENINVGERSIEFVWSQGSQSGLGELRFVRGRLVGTWGYGESVSDGGSWEMAKK